MSFVKVGADKPAPLTVTPINLPPYFADRPEPVTPVIHWSFVIPGGFPHVVVVYEATNRIDCMNNR